jgi:hypothetical protein
MWVDSGFTACTRSGNFIASCMKNTGMVLPTRFQLPSSVQDLTAKPRTLLYPAAHEAIDEDLAA